MSFYCSDLKADGHGEVWVDSTSDAKFKQYGWRCKTKEDSYSSKTLIGNWNQEWYDQRKLKERKPLPSQYAHYFETTYTAEYSRNKNPERQERITIYCTDFQERARHLSSKSTRA